MHSLINCVLAACLLGAGTLQAQQYPVVVELFTSQGCSSCPAADALLAQFDDSADVIPLALHVDYWDYIGWKDRFAKPQFTERQKGYAAALDNPAIYTPQMIVNGSHDVVGNRSKDLNALIEAHKNAPSPVALDISRDDGMLSIRAVASTDLGPADVSVVRYLPHEAVEITDGENAGHTVSNTHIVTGWTILSTWDGRGTFTAQTPISGTEPVVVLVQGAAQGPIFAAARLR